MKNPSFETQKKMFDYFRRTSAPRIIKLMKHKGITDHRELKCNLDCYKLIFEEGKDCEH